MYLILTMLAVFQPPASIDAPSMESLTAAWKKQAVLPGNYSLTFRCYHLRINTEASSNVATVAHQLSKLGNDVSFETLTGLLSNAGILEMADKESIKPTKLKVLASENSVCNRMYQTTESNIVIASFSRHNDSLVYRNDMNKTYDLYAGTRSLYLDKIHDMIFVPAGIENMVKFNPQQSDNTKIHLDIDSKEGKGFYMLDPTSKQVKYFEALSYKNNSMRIVEQAGQRISGKHLIPACTLDYSGVAGTVHTLKLYLVDSFEVDSVIDRDFVSSYKKNWLIKDFRLNDIKPDLVKYDYEFDDVLNHLKSTPK